MDNARSLYLEFLRISAAFYVFICHFGTYKYFFSTEDFNDRLGLDAMSAHYFVIVFFVLSGYLITMSVNRPGITFKSFIVARLGRLYSVLIPALIFTFVVAYFLLNFGFVDPDLVTNTNNLVIRFILNLTFLSQSWTLCSTPPFNGPFWSVNYEFMYYLLIGATLIPKKSTKILLIVTVIIISGPKVIILAPTWFIGSLLYKVSSKKLMNTKISLGLFLITCVLLLLIIQYPLRFPFTKELQDNLFFGMNLLLSWNYQSDYIFSFIVALNIYSFFGISKAILEKGNVVIIEKLMRIMRPISNCSYTLYLFHLPLLYLYVSILPYDKTNPIHQVIVLISVMITVYFIARKTEWKVDYWRNLVSRAVEFGSSKVKMLSISNKKKSI